MSIKRYDSETKELTDVAGVYKMQGGGATIEVDDGLDSESGNPVENRVIVSALVGKQPIQLVSSVMVASHAYGEVESTLHALSTRLEATMTSEEIGDALDKKQPIQLVSAMMLESNPYTTVPTALGALATRLEDTYTKNETDLKTAGLLNPQGTVTFVNLPTLADAKVGDMYNVSDEFVTTSDFMEGAGEYVPAGANVYKTSSDKWDVLAGSPVTGVKGDKESTYRRGNVNITPTQIGAYSTSESDETTATIAEALDKWYVPDSFTVTIDFYGYGEPTLDATENANKNYLDQSSGWVYNSQEKTDEAGVYEWIQAVQFTATKVERLEGTKASVDDLVEISSLAHENRQTVGYTTKNKLKITAENTTEYGVNFTINSDGTVTMSGTSDGSHAFKLGKVALPAGTYTVSDGGDGTLPYVQVTNEAENTQLAAATSGKDTFTLSETTTVVARITYAAGSVNKTFAPMIRDASITDDTFVPYQGEDVDTRLTAEEDRSVVFEETLGYSRKNLLKVTATSGTINGITYTVNEDGSVFIAGGQTASGSAIIRLNNDIALEKNGNYKFNGASSNTRSARLDLTSNVDSAETWENYGEEIDIIGNQTTSFRCSIIIGDGYTVPSSGLLFKPMIRDASITDDTFVPYQGESVDYRLKEKDDYNLLEITAESKSVNGITFTVDRNAGTVTANGTATSETVFTVCSLFARFPSSTYVFSGGSSGNVNTYKLIYHYFNSSSIEQPLADIYDDEYLTATIPSDYNGKLNCYIVVSSGQTLINQVFKPMVSKPEYNNMPFKPYKTPILRERYAEIYGAKNLLNANNYVKKTIGGADTNIRVTTYGDDSILAKKGEKYIYSKANDSSLSFAIVQVDTSGDLIYDGKFTTDNSQEFNPIEDGFLRINIRKNDDSTITIQDVIDAKFMIRHASIQSDTYVPYAKTNRELTEDVAVLPGNAKKNYLQVTAKTQTLNGIDFTINTNDYGECTSVVVNGTATANTFIRLNMLNYSKLKGMLINGCSSNDKDISIYCGRRDSFSEIGTSIRQYNGNDVLIEDDDTDPVYLEVGIFVGSGKTASNIVIYPMIRPVGTNPGFEPYCMSNEELTNESNQSVKINSWLNSAKVSVLAPNAQYIDDNSYGDDRETYGFPSWNYVPARGVTIQNMSYANVFDKLYGSKYVMNYNEETEEVTADKTPILRLHIGAMFLCMQDGKEILIGIKMLNTKYITVFKTDGFTATVGASAGGIRLSLSGATTNEVTLDVIQLA